MKFSGIKPIFEEIADYYENMINIGVYKSGDYLPSVREVALENKINPNTVAHAFSILVQKGIITSIPKKGYQINEISKMSKDRTYNKLKNELIKLLEQYTLEEIQSTLIDLGKENLK